jgi:hypothetical protein
MLAFMFGAMGAGCRTASSDPASADDGDGTRSGDSDSVGTPELTSEGGPDSASSGERSTGVGSDGASSEDEAAVDTVYDTNALIPVWDSDIYRDTVANTDPGYADMPDASFPDASWDAAEMCPDWDLHAEPNPSRIMILNDISDTGGQDTPARWDEAKAALISLLGTYRATDLLEIGFDVFPDRGDCYTDDPVVLDSAPYNGQNIFDLLPLLESHEGTPLFMAMGNFLDESYAPVFADKTYPSYLIVISDGGDTCGDEAGHAPGAPYGASASELGARSRDLLQDAGIFTIAVGFGDEADPEQLDAIAQNGGTDYDQHIPAGDGQELDAVLRELAAYVVDCEFEVSIVGPDPRGTPVYEYEISNIEFSLDGDLVPRDPGCESGLGWDWIIEMERLVFCDAVCAEISEKGTSSITRECSGPPYIIPN